MGKIIEEDAILSPLAAVPDKKKHLKRYPFLFLIDVSGSTGAQPDPDIVHINKSLAAILDIMRKPTPSSDLAQKVDAIDICVIAYSDSPFEVLPWSTVENLPAQIPTLTDLHGTSTGKAVKFALGKIANQIAYYRSQTIKSAPAHIIHLTDGAIMDCKPGDPLWTEITAQINKLSGNSSSTLELKPRVTILNFVSPKGCVDGFVDVDGRKMSGQQLLAEFSGPMSVYEMGRELDSFESLVKLIEITISKLSHNIPATDALEAAKKAAKKDTRTTLAG